MGVGFVAEGVIPACLLPFDPAEAIDIPSYRRHLHDLVAIDGVTGIVLNGHAAEVHALSFDEQRAAMVAAADTVGGAKPLICGVYAESTRLAAKLARAAAADHYALGWSYLRQADTSGDVSLLPAARKHFTTMLDINPGIEYAEKVKKQVAVIDKFLQSR